MFGRKGDKGDQGGDKPLIDPEDAELLEAEDREALDGEGESIEPSEGMDMVPYEDLNALGATDDAQLVKWTPNFLKNGFKLFLKQLELLYTLKIFMVIIVTTLLNLALRD